MFDKLLEREIPEGSTLIEFADDVAMVVTAKTEESLMNKANTCLLLVTIGCVEVTYISHTKPY